MATLSFDDYGNDLPLGESASPGLDTLPAEAAPSDATSLFGGADVGPPAPAPVEDRSTTLGFAPAPATPSSGSGVAAYKSARSSDEMEYLRNLPTGQKVGLVLQAFGAGVNGQPNPIDALLANKQKREAEFRNEIGTTLQIMKEGSAMVAKLPPGKGRDALIEQLTRIAGPNGTAVKDALLAVGTDKQNDLSDVISVLENPRAQAMLVKAVANSPEPRKEAQKLLSDSDYMKRLEQAADQDTLPSVTAKLAVITRTMEKTGKYAGPDGSLSFSMADLRSVNAQLPKEYQLTRAELGAANRNQPTLIPYGLRTDTTLQVEQSSTAKQKEEGPLTELAKLNADLHAKRITPDQYQQGIRKAMMPNERMNLTISTNEKKEAEKTAMASALSPEAIDDAGHRYAIDGTLPPNMGRGMQGVLNTAKILNRAAEIARENGDGGEEARITQIANKANTQALGQLEKQRNLVVAFEKNAVKNTELVREASEKVDRLGVPALDRWLQAGQKEIAGDVHVAQLDTAIRTLVNEYARVTTSVTGGGITSDTARKEIESLLRGAHTKEQVLGVIDFMKREMNNRVTSYADQVNELKGSMRSGGKAAAPAPAASTAKAAPASATAAPAGIPPGSRKVGFSRDGREVWQDPTGKKWVK